jgi:hypothetical protein
MKTRMNLSTPIPSSFVSSRKIKGTLIIVLTFVFLAVIEYTASAQIRPAATVSSKGVVQLPTDKPLASHYEFDLTNQNIGNSSQLTEFLSSRSGSDYFVRANPETNKVILILDQSQHPDWTVERWNQHLQAKTTEKSFKK